MSKSYVVKEPSSLRRDPPIGVSTAAFCCFPSPRTPWHWHSPEPQPPGSQSFTPQSSLLPERVHQTPLTFLRLLPHASQSLFMHTWLLEMSQVTALPLSNHSCLMSSKTRLEELARARGRKERGTERSPSKPSHKAPSERHGQQTPRVALPLSSVPSCLLLLPLSREYCLSPSNQAPCPPVPAECLRKPSELLNPPSHS